MNKATIVEDAITYIEKLQDKVQNLSQELHQMEATSVETAETKIVEIDAVEDMKNWGIQVFYNYDTLFVKRMNSPLQTVNY